jgi:hypothetical protein
MARKLHQFEPLTATVEVAVDGIALLKFGTDKEDIALLLSADVFLRLRDRIEHALEQKGKPSEKK